LVRLTTKSVSADAVLKKTQTKTVSADAVLSRPSTRGGGIIKRGFHRGRKQNVKPLDVDADPHILRKGRPVLVT